MPLGIDFLKDFGGFWKVKWRQVGSKIGAKIDQKSVPGGLWRHLAANTVKGGWVYVFGPPLGAILTASWAVLAASWGRLGGLGGLLGPSWARLGGRKRTRTRPNIDPKIDQNFDAFGDRLLGGFWRISLPKMEPRCFQKPPGNRCQSQKAIFQNLVFPMKNNDFGGSGSPT